jgi:hypothetical protein
MNGSATSHLIKMNIFELTRVLAILAGGTAAYYFVSPLDTLLGVLAAIAGAVGGFFVGPFIGFLFLLPFEGSARLARFLKTGRWTDSQFTSESNKLKADDHSN